MGALLGRSFCPMERTSIRPESKTARVGGLESMRAADIGLARAKAEARKAKRGRWQDTTPVPPWEFRKVKRAALKAIPKTGLPLSVTHLLQRRIALSPFASLSWA
jgi:hypothetical protein